MKRLEAKVYIVGAGPGDPDLITVKGQQVLQNADVILYTDSLVSEELIARARPDALVLKSSGMDLQQIVGLMVAHVRGGKSVARVHTGDPAVYGAIFEQMAMLKKEKIPVEIIPGVSSVFAAAAVLGAELTIPKLTQTLILTRAEGRTPVPEKEKLRELAAHQTTIALFLSATLTKKVVNELLEAGWSEDTPVAVVQKATWPEQKIVRSTLKHLDEEMRKAGIRSHAMILAGWALDPDLYEQSEAYRSKLYDPSFTHGYRKGGNAS
ncbi:MULTISPECIES: precorrin-4 C(11)-methyltransferase [Thermoactinomyces]|uniref:Precorrin-4 C(11)-methyltransferase n=1 Tax=Thermoactinomyces daqus TaxID=1329516 RepID=A0A7W2AJQ1_9BACL|nr:MULTISPECIES: precorrin-4 C(11)-methyltransferase [Thermoactinomyces]MBA4544108.1 precorrin-4 C(11)-methyltransferase [Thermoactinomyces daqus]MBH8599345.1 precorrin-4 C(11)-methyltransferase [Thermoactinomyces sp. CICC 10523]MBH8605299.1 precorrin-4 C(11)-methyltransferase [Thermoactinomyces sp. CICC 10522]